MQKIVTNSYQIRKISDQCQFFLKKCNLSIGVLLTIIRNLVVSVTCVLLQAIKYP
jgi:hypothetical protein